MKLKKMKKFQKVFKSNLINKIVTGKYKSKEKKRELQTIKNFYAAWEKSIKLFDDYSLIASKAKYKTIHGEGTKILTHARSSLV